MLKYNYEVFHCKKMFELDDESSVSGDLIGTGNSYTYYYVDLKFILDVCLFSNFRDTLNENTQIELLFLQFVADYLTYFVEPA